MTKATPATCQGSYGPQQLKGPPAHPSPVPLKNGSEENIMALLFGRDCLALDSRLVLILERNEGFT